MTAAAAPTAIAISESNSLDGSREDGAFQDLNEADSLLSLCVVVSDDEKHAHNAKNKRRKFFFAKKLVQVISNYAKKFQLNSSIPFVHRRNNFEASLTSVN